MADDGDHEKPADAGKVEGDFCGLIMPISATANHDQTHWESILNVLGRAAKLADLVPRPVWIDSSNDRVSERIIGNIYSDKVVIADITDLNPNVMLELGLRLASKKPTLAVMEEGGVIPFDIRDFHVKAYPLNLSIIKTEKFIKELAADILKKKVAFDDGAYTPFLKSVVVDVVAPDQREVPINQFIIDQLETLNKKISDLDSRYKRSADRYPGVSTDRILSSVGGAKSSLFYTVPVESYVGFEKDAIPINGEITEIGRDDKHAYFKFDFPGGNPPASPRKRLDDLCKAYGGSSGAPQEIVDRFRVRLF